MTSVWPQVPVSRLYSHWRVSLCRSTWSSGTAGVHGTRARQLRCDAAARLRESNEWQRSFT